MRAAVLSVQRRHRIQAGELVAVWRGAEMKIRSAALTT